MDEITRIADRATILRDGQHVVTAPMSELTLDKIIEHIVGPPLARLFRRQAADAPRAARRFSRSRGLSGPRKPDLDRSHALRRRSRRRRGPARQRTQRAGARAVRHRPQSARARSASRATPVEIASPSDAIANGIALVPEDRLRQGLILEHSVESNTSLVHPRPARLVAVRLVRQGERSRRPADRGPAHQDGLARGGGPHALRRQPAEGRDRQVAERRAGHLHARRADRRRRHRLQGRDHHARPRSRRARQGGARHLLRALGAADRRRPHRGDVGGTHRERSGTRGFRRPQPRRRRRGATAIRRAQTVPIIQKAHAHV